MAFDSSGNEFVDFVWGRTPMQSNTGRTGDGPVTVVEADADQNKFWSGTVVFPAEPLDETLGDHINAITGYNGFPNYTPVAPFTDTVANVTVPNLVGLTIAGASEALETAGLIEGVATGTAVGATEVNDGKVKAQTPAAGTTVNAGTAVDITVFEFVAPEDPE